MSSTYDDNRIYTGRDAVMFGRRSVCYDEGHKLYIELHDGPLRGGVQGINAVCDEIKCKRCDGVFTVTYPTLGRKKVS